MNWQSLRESDPESRVLLAYAASISDPAYRLTSADDSERLKATRARIRAAWKKAEAEIAEKRKPKAVTNTRREVA